MTDVQTSTDTELQHPEQQHPERQHPEQHPEVPHLKLVREEPVGGGAASTRRTVLAGAGAFGATCLLAACGTSTGSTGSNPAGSDYQANPAPAGSGPANAGGGSTADGSTGGDSSGGGATALAAVADVPVGGGVIKGAYVITQPTQGTFKAFSKVCTHQGCDVNKVDGGVIICPCHASKFSIEDGSVKGGPAPKGLPETAVKASGKNIVKA